MIKENDIIIIKYENNNINNKEINYNNILINIY